MQITQGNRRMATYLARWGQPSPHTVTTTIELEARDEVDARHKATTLAAKYRIRERLPAIRVKPREVAA